MYRFVDQPLQGQSEGARFLIWATRHWVAAAVQGRCVCHTLNATFSTMRVDAALDDFHLAMRTLCNNPLIPLRFGALDRPEITEHEAILAATALAAVERGEADVKEVARQLVHADMAALFASSFTRVATIFANAELAFEVAAGEQRPGR